MRNPENAGIKWAQSPSPQPSTQNAVSSDAATPGKKRKEPPWLPQQLLEAEPSNHLEGSPELTQTQALSRIETENGEKKRRKLPWPTPQSRADCPPTQTTIESHGRNDKLKQLPYHTLQLQPGSPPTWATAESSFQERRKEKEHRQLPWLNPEASSLAGKPGPQDTRPRWADEEDDVLLRAIEEKRPAVTWLLFYKGVCRKLPGRDEDSVRRRHCQMIKTSDKRLHAAVEVARRTVHPSVRSQEQLEAENAELERQEEAARRDEAARLKEAERLEEAARQERAEKEEKLAKEIARQKEAVRQKTLSRENQLARQERLARKADLLGQQPTASLLSLPVNLRTIIYQYVIAFTTDECPDERERMDYVGINPIEALSQTCRAVRLHLIYLYLSQTQLVVHVNELDPDLHEFWRFVGFLGPDLTKVVPSVKFLIDTTNTLFRPHRGTTWAHQRLKIDLIDFAQKHEAAFSRCTVAFKGTNLDVMSDHTTTLAFRMMTKIRESGTRWGAMTWSKSRMAIHRRGALVLGRSISDKLIFASLRKDPESLSRFQRRENLYLGYAASSVVSEEDYMRPEENKTLMREAVFVTVVSASNAITQSSRGQLVCISAEQSFLAFKRSAELALAGCTSDHIRISNFSRTDGSILDGVAFADFKSEVLQSRARVVLFVEGRDC